MFQVLITTILNTQFGAAVHTTIAQFEDEFGANLAERAINERETQPHHRVYVQTALRIE